MLELLHANSDTYVKQGFTVNIGWQSAADDAKVGPVITETLDLVVKMTKSRATWNKFTFLNDAYLSQPVFENYGSANRAKLQSIARRHDPAGVFQTLLPGGFKLF